MDAHGNDTYGMRCISFPVFNLAFTPQEMEKCVFLVDGWVVKCFWGK